MTTIGGAKVKRCLKRIAIAILLFVIGAAVFYGNSITLAVDPEVAEDAIRANEYAGILQGKYEKQLPDTDFGGVWIDNRSRVQVGLTEATDAVNERRLTIQNEANALRVEDIVDIVFVKNSWSTLMDTNEKIRQLYEDNVDYENGQWPIAMGIKTDMNKVQVDIPADETKLTDGHRVVLSEIEKTLRIRYSSKHTTAHPKNRRSATSGIATAHYAEGLG